MINLLSEKKIKFDRQSQFALKVKAWSGLVLVGYIAVMVMSVLIGQVYSIRLNSTNKALNKAKLQLASKVLLIQQYDLVVERAGIIKKILVERRESIKLWSTVKSLIPAGVELTKFGLDGNTLSLGFTAPHVVLANQMQDVIETQFQQLNPQRITVGINRSDDASYMISADLLLP